MTTPGTARVEPNRDRDLRTEWPGGLTAGRRADSLGLAAEYAPG
jgi:hypothetical protein